MLDMVILDMDGVIFEGKNFWLELHDLMGTRKQAMQLWRGLQLKDYNLLSRHTARIWAGQSAEPFWKLIETRRLIPGIESLLNYLHGNKIPCAIVSSGPYQLAEIAQNQFPINAIYANRLHISRDGYFTGDVDVMVDDSKKDLAALEVMRNFGARSTYTAMIGDTISDVLVARVARISICFNTHDEVLVQECRYRVTTMNLSDVIPILQKYVSH